MNLINQALIAAPTAVLIITELLKLVPTKLTQDHPAWVNGILSAIAAFMVIKPSFNLHDVSALVATALSIAVLAAVAYNQFTSKLKKTA